MPRQDDEIVRRKEEEGPPKRRSEEKPEEDNEGEKSGRKEQGAVEQGIEENIHRVKDQMCQIFDSRPLTRGGEICLLGNIKQLQHLKVNRRILASTLIGRTVRRCQIIATESSLRREASLLLDKWRKVLAEGKVAVGC